MCDLLLLVETFEQDYLLFVSTLPPLGKADHDIIYAEVDIVYTALINPLGKSFYIEKQNGMI